MNLEKINGVVVEINSSPKQRIISNSGEYSFSLPIGDYKIIAYHEDNTGFQKTEESISVTNEGDFILDLFLFPDISNEESISNTSEFNFQAPFKSTNSFSYILIIIILILAIIIIIAIIFFFKKKENKTNNTLSINSNSNELINKLLRLIEKSDGRITQKEIRKEIPMSEAKISLMIAELESEGKIKKIKKGRGNIIVLNK